MRSGRRVGPHLLLAKGAHLHGVDGWLRSAALLSARKEEPVLAQFGLTAAAPLDDEER